MAVASTPTALSVTGLAKSVLGGRTLFEGLELEARPGEIVAILGESGVGKSTLLNLFAGLDLPDAGEIVVEGTRLRDLDDDARTILRRTRIRSEVQAFHNMPHLTLAENLELPLG